MIPPGSVIVTPEDMWAAIGEIRETGHRTETAINELRLSVNPTISDLRQDLDMHEKAEREHQLETGRRLTVLETARWKMVGAYSALTLLIAVAEALYYTFKK